jgi:hypothetical protein
MDEWIRTILGGLVGGGIATVISWVKYRDERRDRLRDAYVAVLGAVERYRMSTGYVEMHLGGPALGPQGLIERLVGVAAEVKVAIARAEFLESSQGCLARLAVLNEAVVAYHRASILGLEETLQGMALDAETSQRNDETRDEAESTLKDAVKLLMSEAKSSIDRT